MARTDWGAVIIGGSALLGIAYVFFNWKTICPQIMGGPQNCPSWPWKSGDPGLFGGTLIGPKAGLAQGYGQIRTDPVTGKVTQINPKAVIAGASVPANFKVNPKKTLNATGSARIGVGAGAGARVAAYTDSNINSFNTFTLNRVSIR